MGEQACEHPPTAIVQDGWSGPFCVVERCFLCRSRRTRPSGFTATWSPWRSPAEQVRHALLKRAKQR